jgi:hypothetical protein
MSAGYSGTPLPTKLGIRPGHRVAALGAPRDLPALLDALPPNVQLVRDPRGRGPFDVILAFVRTEAELRRRFARGRALLDVHGGLWACWPKQSSLIATRVREGHVREHGLSTGLVDNKICAIDEDWSGLRFVVRLADRPKVPVGKGHRASQQ